MKRFIIALAIVGTLLALAPVAALSANQVDLAWDANTEPDLAGYQLYACRVAVLVQDNPVSSIDAQIASGECVVTDVGNVTTYSYFNMPAGETWQWAGTAYDNADVTSAGNVPRNESVFSNVVQQTFYDTDAPAAPSSLQKAVITGSLTGGLTGTYTLTFEPEEGVIIE